MVSQMLLCGEFKVNIYIQRLTNYRTFNMLKDG
jgi:hypothetical protein